jgi:hypothetical protein
MQTITHFIGQLIEVKPTEYRDKKTEKLIYQTEVTAFFEGIDEEGFKKVSVETSAFDEEYYDLLKDKKGKYVAIPYVIDVNQYATRAYPNKNMPIMEFDKNPFDYSKFDRSSKAVTK